GELERGPEEISSRADRDGDARIRAELGRAYACTAGEGGRRHRPARLGRHVPRFLLQRGCAGVARLLRRSGEVLRPSSRSSLTMSGQSLDRRLFIASCASAALVATRSAAWAAEPPAPPAIPV